MPNFSRIFCIFVGRNLQILLVLPFLIRSTRFFTSRSNDPDRNPANATRVARSLNCEKVVFHVPRTIAPADFLFCANAKTKATSELLRRRLSTAKRGNLKHKMHAQGRTRRSHQNLPFDTKTVSNARACVKVIPDISRRSSAQLAPHTPRFAHNRRYTAARRPPSSDSARAETHRHIPAPPHG